MASQPKITRVSLTNQARNVIPQQSILLQGIIERKRRNEETLKTGDIEEDHRQKLAMMDVAKFKAPTKGVAVGVATTADINETKYSRNFLQARILARNLGISNNQHSHRSYAIASSPYGTSNVNKPAQLSSHRSAKNTILKQVLQPDQSSSYGIIPQTHFTQEIQKQEEQPEVLIQNNQWENALQEGQSVRVWHDPRSAINNGDNDPGCTSMRTETRIQMARLSSLQEINGGVHTSLYLLNQNLTSDAGRQDLQSQINNSMTEGFQPVGKKTPRQRQSQPLQPSELVRGMINKHDQSKAKSILNLDLQQELDKDTDLCLSQRSQRLKKQQQQQLLAIKSGEKIFEVGNNNRNGPYFSTSQKPPELQQQQAVDPHTSSQATPRGPEFCLNAKYSHDGGNQGIQQEEFNEESPLLQNSISISKPASRLNSLECIQETSTSHAPTRDGSPRIQVKSRYVPPLQLNTSQSEYRHMVSPSPQDCDTSSQSCHEIPSTAKKALQQQQQQQEFVGRPHMLHSYKVKQKDFSDFKLELEGVTLLKEQPQQQQDTLSDSKDVQTLPVDSSLQSSARHTLEEAQQIELQQQQWLQGLVGEKMQRKSKNMNFPVGSRAITQGNINISRILGKAQQSELFQRAHNAYTCSKDLHESGKRNSVGLINFTKPVSKLVSDVAQAIGESVRKMQPRSQQRSVDASKQDLVGCNSAISIAKNQPSFRIANSSQAARHRSRIQVAQREKSASSSRINNKLLNKIAQITMDSSNMISENQLLKENLEVLAIEQKFVNTYTAALASTAQSKMTTIGVTTPPQSQLMMRKKQTSLVRSGLQRRIKMVGETLADIGNISNVKLIAKQIKVSSPQSQKRFCEQIAEKNINFDKQQSDECMVKREMPTQTAESPVLLQISRKPILQPRENKHSQKKNSGKAGYPSPLHNNVKPVVNLASPMSYNRDLIRFQITEEGNQEQDLSESGLKQCSTQEGLFKQEHLIEPIQPVESCLISPPSPRLKSVESYPATINNEQAINEHPSEVISHMNIVTDESPIVLQSENKDFVIVAGDNNFQHHHDTSMLPVYDGGYSQLTASVQPEYEYRSVLPDSGNKFNNITTMLQSPASNESIISDSVSGPNSEVHQLTNFCFNGLRIQSQGLAKKNQKQINQRHQKTQLRNFIDRSKAQTQQFLQRANSQEAPNSNYSYQYQNMVAKVSKYASTKPNRWLQEAILRGNKERRNARKIANLQQKPRKTYDARMNSFVDGTETSLPIEHELSIGMTECINVPHASTLPPSRRASHHYMIPSPVHEIGTPSSILPKTPESKYDNAIMLLEDQMFAESVIQQQQQPVVTFPLVFNPTKIGTNTSNEEKKAIFEEIKQIQDFKTTIKPIKKKNSTDSVPKKRPQSPASPQTSQPALEQSSQVEFKALPSKVHLIGFDAAASQPTLRKKDQFYGTNGSVASKPNSRGFSGSQCSLSPNAFKHHNSIENTTTLLVTTKSKEFKPSAIKKQVQLSGNHRLRVQGERVSMTHSTDTGILSIKSGDPPSCQPGQHVRSESMIVKQQQRANSAITTEKMRGVTDESIEPSPMPYEDKKFLTLQSQIQHKSMPPSQNKSHYPSRSELMITEHQQLSEPQPPSEQ